ncbi:hypothetical protein VP01_1276g4 [Puccinia sorghi]|uniref:Uncharacterized protein n=1 Tax=Puccinia sorghi TaxID=27349 RepID=A0A0L6VP42_9BASI|nr:hypothetical protein VP01_1276g4 [Puccinia sorghi]
MAPSKFPELVVQVIKHLNPGKVLRYSGQKRHFRCKSLPVFLAKSARPGAQMRGGRTCWGRRQPAAQSPVCCGAAGERGVKCADCSDPSHTDERNPRVHRWKLRFLRTCCFVCRGWLDVSQAFLFQNVYLQRTKSFLLVSLVILVLIDNNNHHQYHIYTQNE